MIRPTIRTIPVVAATALLAGTLTACGSVDSFAGIEPAPVEVTTAAPVTAGNATTIAARVLAEAAKARAATGDEAAALRRTALTGPALAVADAASRDASGTPDDVVGRRGEPQVVAISRGVGWPRYLVVTTVEKSVPSIHLLVAPDARTPFKAAASATVRAGTAAFEDLAKGAPVLTDGAGLAATPQSLLTAYAGALAYPKPVTTQAVSVADPFAALIRAKVTAQAKSLGKLAEVTEKHTVNPKQTVAIGLKDGGALVFGLLTRTDTVTRTADAQSLTFTTPDGRKQTLKKGATLVTYEIVVLKVPTSGVATLLAADEQLISTKTS